MFQINKDSHMPLYKQLYQTMKRDIEQQTLKRQEKLPGTRTLAKQLRVSRITVEKAYNQLCEEGYIEVKPRSGFYVAQLPTPFSSYNNITAQQVVTEPNKEQASVREPKYDLTNSSHTSNLFPKKVWKKYMLEALDTLDQEEMISTLQNMDGEVVLKQNLMQYLSKIRGVSCTIDQIIITSGIQQSIDYLCKITQRTSNNILIENPSYPKARAIFEHNDMTMQTAELDEQGIQLHQIPQQTKFDLIYTTPSHQFPTGVVMSIQRRHELLQFAEQHDAFIIEDDYDSELRYYNQPIPALQSIDYLDRVVYMGTFSKVLSPSLRMGYMILPKQLVKRFKDKFRMYNSTVSLLNQHIVAKILASGEYDRIVRRMNSIFKKRFETFQQAFAQFQISIQLSQSLSGQYLLIEFDHSINQQEMINKALEQGVKVYSTMEFWQDQADCPDNALFLGFSKIDVVNITDCVERLRRAWEEK